MKGGVNKQQFLGMNKGGNLILTDRRLVFLAHSINFGSKFDEILFDDIAFSGNTLNIFLPVPHMIKVVTKDGKSHEFVVFMKQKQQWKEKISEAVKEYKLS